MQILAFGGSGGNAVRYLLNAKQKGGCGDPFA